MKTRIPYGWILLFLPVQILAQFNGGNGDGYSMNYLNGPSMNLQETYCSGGNGDGYSGKYTGGLSANQQQAYCSGGNGDGYSTLYLSGSVNPQGLFCSGGNGDGFSRFSYTGSVNVQWTFSNGGNGDGFSSKYFSGDMYNGWMIASGGSGDGYADGYKSGSVNDQPQFCKGGDGDGYMAWSSPVFHLGFWIWTGVTSNSWTVSSNWSPTSVPDYTMAVRVNSGCPRYPLLNGILMINSSSSLSDYSCRSLEIQSGAEVTNSGELHICGDMSVSGSFIASNSTSFSQLIEAGGKLVIPYPGVIKFGNQSTGSGSCDLVVNQGILSVEGGTLEIDDQLIILSGGAFFMNGGTVFAHKYGNGEDYSSSSPGAFFIDEGAYGDISGGTVKVAGKASLGGLSAINIKSPDFDFTGTGTLELVHGDNPTHYDVEIKVAEGAELKNLAINKPGNAVSIITDATITGNLILNTQSVLVIIPGIVVSIANNISLNP